MSSALAKPLLHTAHLATFALLLTTGLLLYAPSLRAALVGGYSLVIRRVHCWGGVAFVIVPALIVAVFGVRRAFAPPLERSSRAAWQAIHLGITTVISVAFSISGFILWAKALVSDPVFDGSLAVHDWFTYAAAALVTLHLADVGFTAVRAHFSAAVAATPAQPNE